MKWGGKWGDPWGCPSIKFFIELCESYQWKQLDHAPNFENLCRIIIGTFGDIDEKITEMGERIGLDLAFGAELDQWGAMVNQPRHGVNDDLYRRAIKAAARKVFNEGRPDDFHDIAELINPNVDLRIQELFPACVRLFIGNVTQEEQKVIFDLMRHTDDTPGVAGLAICLQFVEIDPDNLFEFSYLNDDLTLLPIDHHWDHTDHDIPADQISGFAYQF